MIPRPDPLRRPLEIALLVGIVAFYAYSEYFGREMMAEVAILAIFCMSLDLLVGYAGMVSLGHAAFFGIGAYGMAVLTSMAGWPPIAALPVAVGAAALAALVVGVFCVRLTGVFFIMITLAFAEMFYAFFFKDRTFGGGDGLGGIPRFDLSALGLDMSDPTYYAPLVVLLAVGCYLLMALIVRSPFGHALVGIHRNEHRLRALGCPVRRYKLSVFVMAGAFAGFAGSLMAQHTQFVSPDLLFWTVSGEALIMVIVGGAGSLLGPVFGAVVIVFLREELSSLTDYWMLFMGLFFVAVVLFAGEGIYGLIGRVMRKVRGRSDA
jgi:branched-chain amino acid transport system permease protein